MWYRTNKTILYVAFAFLTMFVKIQICANMRDIYVSLRTSSLSDILHPRFTDPTMSVLQSESPISSARTPVISHSCPLYHSSTSQAWPEVEHRHTDVVRSGLILRKISRKKLATYQIIEHRPSANFPPRWPLVVERGCKLKLSGKRRRAVAHRRRLKFRC